MELVQLAGMIQAPERAVELLGGVGPRGAALRSTVCCDCALALACRWHALPADHGRGLDDLPAAVRKRFEGTLVKSPDPAELFRALGRVIDALPGQFDEVPDLAAKVMAPLRELKTAWSG